MSDEKRIAIMQAVSWSKLRRVRRFLMRSSQRTQKITTACNQLRDLANLVYRHDSIESLQGLIGQAMLQYYSALPDCFNLDWGFTSRHDNSPVSRMLDFANKLLSESIKTAVDSVGLDPAVGYWHSSYKNQLGLIADFRGE